MSTYTGKDLISDEQQYRLSISYDFTVHLRTFHFFVNVFIFFMFEINLLKQLLLIKGCEFELLAESLSWGQKFHTGRWKLQWTTFNCAGSWRTSLMCFFIHFENMEVQQMKYQGLYLLVNPTTLQHVVYLHAQFSFAHAVLDHLIRLLCLSQCTSESS